MVGPADAIKIAGNHQSHLSSNVNNVAQRVAARMIDSLRPVVAGNR